MRLSLKIPAVVAALLVAVAAAGAFGICQLNGAAKAYARVIDSDHLHERLTSRAAVEFKTQVQEWKNVLLRGKDAELRQKHWAAFEAREASVRQQIEQLRRLLDEPNARELADRFDVAHAAMGKAYRQGLAKFEASDFDPAVGDAAVKGIDRAADKLLHDLGGAVVNLASRNVEYAEKVRARAIVLSAWLMVVTSLAGIVGIILICRSMSRSLREAVRLAETVAAGDLSEGATCDREDEIGDLLRALQRMAAHLARVVGTVRMTSEGIAAAAGQVATGSQDLSRRTEEQASNLQQTAASMEQISGAARGNADMAHQANVVAESASTVATHGGEMVERLVHTMDV